MDWSSTLERYLRGAREDRAAAKSDILEALRGADAAIHLEMLESLLKGLRLADQYEVEDLIAQARPAAPAAPEPVRLGERQAAYDFERTVHRRLFSDAAAVKAESEATLASDPNDRDARLALAMTLRKSEPMRARELLEALAAEDPGDPRPWRELAWVEGSDLDKARAHVDRALAIEPRYAAGIALRGFLRLRGGDIEGALGDLDAAVEADGVDVHIRFFRAFSKRLVGDDVGALADFSRLCEMDPSGADWWAERGELYAKNRQFGEAKLDFNQAIRLERTAQTLTRRAVVRLDLGNRPGAEEDLAAALELDPSFTLAHANRGVLRFEQRRFADAAADLERARELDGENKETRVNLAAVYTRLDRAIEACALLEPLLHAPGATANMFARYADALGRLERNDEAAAALKQAMALDPKNHLWGIALADVGFRTADRALAIQGVEHARSTLPPTATKEHELLNTTLADLEKGAIPPQRFNVSARNLVRQR